ncbi:MAG: SGNH/GDSL hydrolase family protein [Lachnospiraceae bacterium]|nr:SGNH/GDSL hydrolase family protein [Lachnospiraceae bacterium]
MIPENIIQHSCLNEGNKTRLAEKLRKAAQGNDITVTFIGGSITQRFDAEAHECYCRLTADWFCRSFPDINVTYINAGIGATGSYIGVHRVDDDILKFNPDLVFVEFSVNDTEDGLARNIEAYDNLLRKIWFHENSPAIITVAMTMEDGWSFQDEHLKVVMYYDIPMISYRNAILTGINSGVIKWPDISDDDIHPNTNGHRVLSELIIAYLKDVKQKSISGIQNKENDFIIPYTTEKYIQATLIRSGTYNSNNECCCRGQNKVFGKLISAGGFETSDEDFGNLIGYWQLESRMTFAVKCRNIGLLYAKLSEGGGDFTVFVDGIKVADLSADFSDGWGDYVEAEEIFAAEETAEHIIEIVKTQDSLAQKENNAGQNSTGKNGMVLVSALAVS